MPNNDVTNRLKAVLREAIGLSEASLKQKNLLLFGAKGRIDSVGLLLLVMTIEKQFGILVDDTEVRAKNFQSVKTLTAFIERKLALREAG